MGNDINLQFLANDSPFFKDNLKLFRKNNKVENTEKIFEIAKSQIKSDSTSLQSLRDIDHAVLNIKNHAVEIAVEENNDKKLLIIKILERILPFIKKWQNGKIVSKINHHCEELHQQVQAAIVYKRSKIMQNITQLAARRQIKPELKVYLKDQFFVVNAQYFLRSVLLELRSADEKPLTMMRNYLNGFLKKIKLEEASKLETSQIMEILEAAYMTSPEELPKLFESLCFIDVDHLEDPEDKVTFTLYYQNLERVAEFPFKREAA